MGGIADLAQLSPSAQPEAVGLCGVVRILEKLLQVVGVPFPEAVVDELRLPLNLFSLIAVPAASLLVLASSKD